MAKSNKSTTSSTMSLHLEPDLRQVVDQAMINFGLENRSSTVGMIIASWSAAMLENATILEVCRQSVSEVRKAEFAALADFYESRARLFRSS